MKSQLIEASSLLFQTLDTLNSPQGPVFSPDEYASITSAELTLSTTALSISAVPSSSTPVATSAQSEYLMDIEKDSDRQQHDELWKHYSVETYLTSLYCVMGSLSSGYVLCVSSMIIYSMCLMFYSKCQCVYG
jgi:hypothetical protein